MQLVNRVKFLKIDFSLASFTAATVPAMFVTAIVPLTCVYASI